MHHPYQCLATCRPDSKVLTSQFLLAASGSKLFSVSIQDGTIVGLWPKVDQEVPKAKEEVSAEIPQGPPSKKRRISNANSQDTSLPNIISITISNAHKYAIIVTAEDKSIRVLEISPDGQLQQLSVRCMPKRPCAIAMNTDDTEILSADKFGDVYSIPLLPTPEEDEAFVEAQKAVAPITSGPSASDTTVHSKANKKSLEMQIKRAKDNPSRKTKEPLNFSHKLLLGHVSMLTDLLITTIGAAAGFEKPRTYLLTSDRDEHIRISRGPPQTHVIEGYCLGHHEFVNKLCLAEPNLLVSGGGDDDLLVWEWLEQKVVNRVNISEAIPRAFRHIQPESEAMEEDVKPRTIAVTGLWRFTTDRLQRAHLLFTCEGVPAIFHFPISSLHVERGGRDIGFIPLEGNPLALAFSGNTIIVSTDNIHKAGSTTDVDPSDEYKARLQVFELVGEDLDGGAVWKSHEHLNHLLVDLNERSTVEWYEKALQSLLYSVENLRKRGGEDN